MATPQPMICKGCWCQMHLPVPIRGPLSLPLRLFGVRRSRMNPNLCTICELMFKVVMRRRNIQAELTILFADLRGYTKLSQTLEVGRCRSCWRSSTTSARGRSGSMMDC